MQFIKKIQNFSSQYELLKKGSKILVGVSGGPDSVCLLDVLFLLAEKHAFELKIVHVNYGLRGKESLADEKLVRQLGEKYQLKVNVLKSKKKAIKGNLENTLRDIRFAYFEKIRKQVGFDLIAIAHNQNDQAETVLMKMMRGAGLNGLSGMRPKSGRIIRPLLQMKRKEILAYLKEKKLIYRMDKSNELQDFTRNKIRQSLLPYLEKEFNPAIITTLSELSFSVADDYDFISNSVEIFVKAVCNEKEAVFLESDFLVLPEALQRQALRKFFVILKGQIQDIELSQIEEIRKVIKSSKSKTKNAIIGGLKISKKGAKIEIFC